MLYRLLECHHDLRGRLAHWKCDAVEADVIVREVSRTYTLIFCMFVVYLDAYFVFRTLVYCYEWPVE